MHKVEFLSRNISCSSHSFRSWSFSREMILVHDKTTNIIQKWIANALQAINVNPGTWWVFAINFITLVAHINWFVWSKSLNNGLYWWLRTYACTQSTEHYSYTYYNPLKLLFLVNERQQLNALDSLSTTVSTSSDNSQMFRSTIHIVGVKIVEWMLENHTYVLSRCRQCGAKWNYVCRTSELLKFQFVSEWWVRIIDSVWHMLLPINNKSFPFNAIRHFYYVYWNATIKKKCN